MNSNSSEHKFPAILKTEDGRIMEYGTASASVEDQCIDFKSEFVPICKMGTPLQIVRTQNDLETQLFTGEVYLSSQRMLRLVEVKDLILPGAQSAYTYEVDIRGQGRALVHLPEKSHALFSRMHKHPSAEASEQSFPVSVYALSMAQIRFTCEMPLAKGQRVILNLRQPICLSELPVEVDVPVAFGANDIGSYRCSILELEGENYLELERFTHRLSQSKKLFPPAGEVTSSD